MARADNIDSPYGRAVKEWRGAAPDSDPPPRVRDLRGERFGLLLVKEFAGHKKNGQTDVAAWLCDCDCGGTKVAAGVELSRGNYNSCGCMNRSGFKDLTGLRFGCWTVQELGPRMHHGFGEIRVKPSLTPEEKDRVAAIKAETDTLYKSVHYDDAVENALDAQFKKGHAPHNTKYLGHEKVSKDGYVEISIDETNPHTGFERRYVLKHRWLWEREHGPVPDGMVLKCKDNRLNTDPSNWELVPRALLPRLNGGFDEEHIDPHGECAAEIHRLAAEAERLRAQIEWADDLYAALAGLKDTHPEIWNAQCDEAYRNYADVSNKRALEQSNG